MAGQKAEARGEVEPSPWVSSFPDYQGNAITLIVRFNEATRQILNASVDRHPDCVFSKILFGVGPDGVPDNTETQFTIPAGPSSIGRGEFVSFGFDTIEDLRTVQITAGL